MKQLLALISGVMLVIVISFIFTPSVENNSQKSQYSLYFRDKFEDRYKYRVTLEIIDPQQRRKVIQEILQVRPDFKYLDAYKLTHKFPKRFVVTLSEIEWEFFKTKLIELGTELHYEEL